MHGINMPGSGECRSLMAPEPSTWWPTVRSGWKTSSAWAGYDAYVCVYQLLRPDPQAWCSGV